MCKGPGVEASDQGMAARGKRWEVRGQWLEEQIPRGPVGPRKAESIPSKCYFGLASLMSPFPPFLSCPVSPPLLVLFLQCDLPSPCSLLTARWEDFSLPR